MIMTKDFSLKFGTVAINTLALQKKREGIKVYNLSAGEPKMAPHPLIAKAIRQALAKGEVFYPPFSGMSELKSAAAAWINKLYKANYLAENTLVVNGGKFGIYLLLQHLLKEGDGVLIPTPYWVSYPAITRLFGGKPIFIEGGENNEWKISAEDVERACKKSKAKILMLNSACNPTGSVYSRKELLEILKVAKKHKLLVVSDEVYSCLIYDGTKFASCASFPQFKDNVVIIHSCSKNFAITGLRVGFVFGPKSIIADLGGLVSHSTSGVTTLSQWAALAAFKNASVITKRVNVAMKKRRDVFAKAFLENFGMELKKPASALYYFVKMADLFRSSSFQKLSSPFTPSFLKRGTGGVKIKDSVKFCLDVFEKANVALVPGKAFGKEGYVRFAFGAPEEELVGGLKVLAKFCGNNNVVL